jgi:ABC-type lipoprotein release transport system permease subunit
VSLEQRLAWRNVWRNKRRTGLCVAATVFAVFLVVLSVAMAAGTHEKMIEDGVRLASGHVSITGQGYLEDRTLERFVNFDPELAKELEEHPAVLGWAPRVTSFALLSLGSASHGAAVIGVDPEREGSVSTLPERLDQGRFLVPGGGREIVLGARLADSLGAGLGDEVLVYGIAYSLETAYELFTVVGTLRLPEPDLERSLSLVSLTQAQSFLVYGERLSEIAIRVASADDSEPVRQSLAASLPGVDVHTWEERMPDLLQFVILDDLGMYLMLVILVVVVAFGILNTILMAILERARELGMMMALGLRPGAVFRVVYWESIFMAGVGLVVGLVLALPTVVYLAAHPIPITGEAISGMTELIGMEPVATFKLKPLNPIGSTITILAVGALAALYPAFTASRGRPADALRSL